MSVVVVAVLEPKAGRVQEILDAFAIVSPLVHQETGCELYAAHTDDESVYMVERWTTEADLAAHAAGAPFEKLTGLIGDVLARPIEVHTLRAVPLGVEALGTIQ